MMILNDIAAKLGEGKLEEGFKKEIIFCDSHTNTYYTIENVKISDGSIILIGR